MTELTAAIVDLDGTVYRGDDLVPGAKAGIEALRNRGIDVLFLSNKAIERRDDYREKLDRLGVSVTRDRVVNSSAITARYLAERHPTDGVFVVGERVLERELEDAGLAITDDPAEIDVVVASMDREFGYDALRIALDGMTEATAFYATNPDRTCPTADGEIPDAAGMIGAIEEVTGYDLDRVLGKPSQVTIDVALDLLETTPDRCLMVGDRLETDIAMGNRAGMTAVLVLTGVTDRTDLGRTTAEPDYVLDSLGEIETVFESPRTEP
ncbi:HAD-IIA family hydrolase [Haloferacaceae archaeon DSL9]